MASGTNNGNGAQILEVLPCVDLSYWTNEECNALEVLFTHHGEKLYQAILDPSNPIYGFEFQGPSFETKLKLSLVNSLGELRASGHGRCRSRETERCGRSEEITDKVLLRYAPGVGEVAGSMVPRPAIVDSEEFGKSQADGTSITRIFVDDHERMLTNVGQMVKKTIFAKYPELAINIMASVGEHDSTGRGGYTDPMSPWFNVFVGYYQIDVRKSGLQRPFGYHSADGAQSEVGFEDLMRLGKADWNYFSNWLYGVPIDRIEPYDKIDMYHAYCSQSPAKVRSKLWHLVELNNWEVVTAYHSGKGGDDALVQNSVLTDLWQQAFGLPTPRRDWPKSFIPTKLATKFYISYSEDEESYHTVIFGGSSPGDRDPATVSRFLDVQLATCRAVIEKHYESLGFEAE